MEKFTLKEAYELIGNGATYRTVNYYKEIYVNDVSKIDGRYYVTQDFINKVIKNQENGRKTISEPRTKTELLKEIEDLEYKVKELEILIGSLNIEIDELKENNSFDVAENERIEVFTQEEYSLFSERLIQWRLQRQEIEQTKVIFETIKDERDFLKTQLEYFKTSNDKILLQHQNLIEIIGQRNRIEAVEKGAIPREPRGI